MSLSRWLLVLVALVFGLVLNSTARAADITPDETRAIAKEAYIYGFPLVDNYRVEYSYFVDRQDPDFKAPWNKGSEARGRTLCLSKPSSALS